MMALRLSEIWITQIAEGTLQYHLNQLHWRIPTKVMRHRTAWQRRPLGTQHKSRLPADCGNVIYVERTESVHTLQERCQCAVRLRTFGSMWLPASWVTQLVQFQGLQVAVSPNLVYFVATQRRSKQILSCSKISYFHKPIFPLEQLQQHKIGYWKLEWWGMYRLHTCPRRYWGWRS